MQNEFLSNVISPSHSLLGNQPIFQTKANRSKGVKTETIIITAFCPGVNFLPGGLLGITEMADRSGPLRAGGLLRDPLPAQYKCICNKLSCTFV